MSSSKRTTFSKVYVLLLPCFCLVLFLSPAAFASSPQPLTVLMASTSTITTVKDCCGAGYQGNLASGSITKITGKWNVPSVTCQPSLGSEQNLIVLMETGGTGFLQVGMIVHCPSGSSVPFYSAIAWFSIDSSATTLSLTIHPGDILSASIVINPSTNKVVAKVSDVTTGQSATHGEVVPGSSGSKVAAWALLRNNASGITTSLADFTTPVKLSGCSFIVSGTKMVISQLSNLEKVLMVDSSNNIMAKTSALSSTGMGFQVTFVRST